MEEILNNPNLEYYRQKFAVVANGNYFSDGRDFIVKSIREFGFEAEGFDDFEGFREYNPTCVLVIGITTQPKPKDPSKIWVAFQTEQLYNEKTGGIHQTPWWLKKTVPYIKEYDIIVEHSYTNAETLEKILNKKRNRKTILVDPIFGAGDKFFDNSGEDEKEYDLFFVGWHSRLKNCLYSRRDVILNALAKKYKVYPPSNNLWGEKKQEAIRKSKICLNLHYEEARFMETGRLWDYFSNHAFVMSDRIYNSYPFVENEDYCSFFLTDIEKKIDYYLSHDEERKRIADNAFEKISRLSGDSQGIASLIDAVLLESDRRNYKKEVKIMKYRRRHQWIYDHLPKNIRDRIM